MRRLISRLIGDRGERAAAAYLRKQGMRIIARQHRTPWGEIDLIARDGDWIVFVEVKTRRSTDAGHPVEAVTPDKQKKLTQLALAFLKRHGLLEARARFDIVAVIWADNAKVPELTHYRHAFEPVGSGQMFS